MINTIENLIIFILCSFNYRYILFFFWISTLLLILIAREIALPTFILFKYLTLICMPLCTVKYNYLYNCIRFFILGKCESASALDKNIMFVHFWFFFYYYYLCYWNDYFFFVINLIFHCTLSFKISILIHRY